MKQHCAALLLISAAASASAQSLCRPSELVVFACPTKPGKLISLCLAGQALTYRYGTKAKVELEQAAWGPGKADAFKYFHYVRAGTYRSSVGFETPDASYEVFSHDEAPAQAESGVRVTLKAGSHTASYRCAKPPEARWFLLDGKVACSDEAMNSCTPPPPR